MVAHARGRERLSLDAGWLFLARDVPTPLVKGHGASYSQAVSGGVAGPAWRTVMVLLGSQPCSASGLTGGVRVEAGWP